jgi:hypothetical protein
MDFYHVAEAERGKWIKLLGGEAAEAYQVGRFEAESDVGGWVYANSLTSVYALAKKWEVTDREAVARLVRIGIDAVVKEGF